MSWQRSMREVLLRGSDRQLYEVSADFHHAIDMLVAMLPSMVDGLAKESEELMRQRRHLDRAMQGTPPTFLVGMGEPKTPLGNIDPFLYWYYYVPHDTVTALLNEEEAVRVAGDYAPSAVIVFEATVGEVYGE